MHTDPAIPILDSRFMPAPTLSFLPPGLSPAASFSLALLPWLLPFLALGGYLARQ
jgi:hypothetical protein